MSLSAALVNETIQAQKSGRCAGGIGPPGTPARACEPGPGRLSAHGGPRVGPQQTCSGRRTELSRAWGCRPAQEDWCVLGTRPTRAAPCVARPLPTLHPTRPRPLSWLWRRLSSGVPLSSQEAVWQFGEGMQPRSLGASPQAQHRGPAGRSQASPPPIKSREHGRGHGGSGSRDTARETHGPCVCGLTYLRRRPQELRFRAAGF